MSEAGKRKIFTPEHRANIGKSGLGNKSRTGQKLRQKRIKEERGNL